MIQQIFVYALVLAALAFLAYKFFIPKRKKKKKGDEGCDDCH
jgi:hypothetical protein